MMHLIGRSKFFAAVLLAAALASPAHAAPVSPPATPLVAPVGAGHVTTVSEKGRCLYRCRILREECSQDAAGASRSDSRCWDSYAGCRNNCGDFSSAGTPAAPPPLPPPSVQPKPRPPQLVAVPPWCQNVREFTDDELAICSDLSLARLDNELRQAYWSLHGGLNSERQEALVAAQREWLKRRQSCGSNVACIATSYRDRLYELRNGI